MQNRQASLSRIREGERTPPVKGNMQHPGITRTEQKLKINSIIRYTDHGKSKEHTELQPGRKDSSKN